MAMTAGRYGPNARTDYHDDPVEEFFYQIMGDMMPRFRQLIFMMCRSARVTCSAAAARRHSPQRPQPPGRLVVEAARPNDVDG
jgi:3-hydroxyanthranilate 3,4-dioxygenase